MVVTLALQHGLLVPVLITVAALCCPQLLLITTLALVAVYSPDPARRAAAEQILDRLLTALRPRVPSTRTPRHKPKTPPDR